jgi:anti-sigma B factor antagonist
MTVPVLRRAPLPALPGREHDDVTVIRLRGDLDVLDAPALQTWLRDIGCQGPLSSIIDLTGLVFIDCACLGVLIRHARETRARGGTLALAGPQGTVLRLLSVTGLLTWFEVAEATGQAAADRAAPRSRVFPAPGGDPPAPLADTTPARPGRSPRFCSWRRHWR